MIEVLLFIYLVGALFTFGIGIITVFDFVDSDQKLGARIALSAPVWPLALLGLLVWLAFFDD